MIVNTVNISEHIYGQSPIDKIKVIFIDSWTTENLLRAFGSRYYKDPQRGIVDVVYTMHGPALTMNHVDGFPAIIFDKNKMTMGDISHQVNMLLDHVAEVPGDVKALTNVIYDMYIKIIENEITETKNEN